MPFIAFQRRGVPFPWLYKAPGTAASSLELSGRITIAYTLPVTDPPTAPPGPDTLARGVRARAVVDPATYAGTLGPDVGVPTFDAYHEKWLLLTFVGAGKLYVVPQAHRDDLEDWLTQPDKTLSGHRIPAPYGTTPKQIAILGQLIKTHVIDYQEP